MENSIWVVSSNPTLARVEPLSKAFNPQLLSSVLVWDSIKLWIKVAEKYIHANKPCLFDCCHIQRVNIACHIFFLYLTYFFCLFWRDFLFLLMIMSGFIFSTRLWPSYSSLVHIIFWKLWNQSGTSLLIATFWQWELIHAL